MSEEINKEEIQKQITQLSEKIKDSSLSGSERIKLQQEKNKLMVLLMDDDSSDEEDKEEKEREEKTDFRIKKFCHNDEDQIGTRLSNYDDLRMILLPNLQTLYCYTTEDIINMLNPGEGQLYYWNGPAGSFCCPIKDKKVYKLGHVGIYLDESAEFLQVFKIVRIVFKERALIGSDLRNRSAVSAIHGQEHDIYRVIPLDVIKLQSILDQIRYTVSKKIELSNDPNYIKVKNKLVELINQKNDISAQIEQKKDLEIEIKLQEFLNRDFPNLFKNSLTTKSSRQNSYDWFIENSILSDSISLLDFESHDIDKLDELYQNHIFTLSDIDSYIRYRKNNGTYDEFIKKIEEGIDTSKMEYKTIQKELDIFNKIQQEISKFQVILQPYDKEYNKKRKFQLDLGDKLVKGCELDIDNNTYFQSILLTVLDKDKNARYEGVKDDLFTQKDIKKININTNLFSIPFIGNNNTLSFNTNLDTFIENYKKNRVLDTMYDYMFKNNMIVAGGYPSGIVTKNFTSFVNVKDVDIFFYNTTPEKAMESIYAIENMLDNQFLKAGVSKTKNTITFVYTYDTGNKTRKGKKIRVQTTIQFILRIYNTKSEILHGFDIGSSAIGFDGENILFTSLSKFAYEFGCNVIDTTRRSTTYENRLFKYLYSFNVLMPDFNLDLLKKNFLQRKNESQSDNVEFLFPYLISFPLNISIEDIEKFNIIGYSCSMYNLKHTESDYNIVNNISINIRNLIQKKYSEIYISGSKRKYRHNDITKLYDILTLDYLQKFKLYHLEHLKNKFNAIFLKSSLCKIRDRLSLINLLYKYLPDPQKLLQIADTVLPQVLKEELIKQYKTAEDNIKALPESVLQVNWVTKNAMTQLTSSFNPIIKEPKDWYGEYYKYNEKFWTLKISDSNTFVNNLI